VPDRGSIQALAAHLSALGEEHAGVHFASIGWILPMLHDPDGHEVRFYTMEHRLRHEALVQEGHGKHVCMHGGDLEEGHIGVAHRSGGQVGVGKVDPFFGAQPRAFGRSGDDPDTKFAVGDPVDEPRQLPIIEYHPLADAGRVECAR
jgi:hypothetical protein